MGNVTQSRHTDKTSLDEIAAQYASLGLELLRLKALSKKPVGSDWQTKPGITNPDEARLSFTDPNLNIGFKPGDGFVGIDIDTKHGGKGLESWMALNDRLGPLPDTVEAVTASGGGLRIYRVPPGSGLELQMQMLGLPDLEFRIGAVNCVLPPSRVRYAPGKLGPDEVIGQHHWKEGRAPDEIEIAELPRIVIEAVQAFKIEKPVAGTKGSSKAKTAAKSVGEGGTVSAMLRDQAKKAAIAKAKPDSLAPVLAGCAWMEHCEADAANLPEPEWHAMLSISTRCENGRELSHKLSEPYAGYSYQETDDKIDHALNDAGPVTCRRVVNELGYEGCARCPFRASITSPVNLANEPRALVQEQRQAVYILELRRWLNLNTGRFLSPESYGDAIQARVGKAPHSLMMSSKSTARVYAMDYLAGASQLILHQEDGSLAVNLWQEGGVKAEAGDPQPILDYLARFIPDTRSREHVTQYLAHLVQRPGEKIEHGIIITGGFGTGKGTLRAILRTMLGERNVKKIEGEELSDKNNVDWVNRQVLIFEEAVQGGKFEVYNRTKELVTDEFFRVQGKWIPLHDGRTPRGIFIMSNEAAPITVVRNDRRWFVCDTPETPETDEEKASNAAFFTELRDLLKRDTSAVAAFRHYLLKEVSLERFPAKGAPPMTAAKKRATEESRTPVAQVVAELIAVGAAPFHKDIVEVKEVIRALECSDYAHTIQRITPQKIAVAVQSVGGKKLNVVDETHLELFITSSVKPRPWAIRNVNRWLAETREAWKTEFLRLPGNAGDNVEPFPEAALKRLIEKVSKAG